MNHRYSIGKATVVMLVLLRLNIGWHFFSEGVAHYVDPRWTSEPVLRNAKGPLAPIYQAYLPDFHGFEAMLHGQTSETPAHAVQSWLDGIGNDWDADRQQFAAQSVLNKSQDARTQEVLREYHGQLRAWAGERKDALTAHAHQWQRSASSQAAPSAEVPFQKERAAQDHRTLVAEANGWMSELKALEADYDSALGSVLTDEQRGDAPAARRATSIDLVDAVMKYAVLGIGLLLIVGLFTRVACVAGAVFLFSVVMMQPFWVSETAPTFNQYVEMFALLTLATTQVGRWAGLDFFVHNLIAGRSRQTKGNSDVSES